MPEYGTMRNYRAPGRLGAPGRVRNVWILNHYAQDPNGTIGRTGHFALAKHLRTLGWRAWIVSASVEHNSGRQRLGDGESCRMERFDEVPFLWLRTPGYQGNGWRRVANIAAYTARAIGPVLSRQLPAPDVVIGTSVHPLAAWAGAVQARRRKVPFVFEVRDLWPQTLVDMGALRARGLPARWLWGLEARLLRRAQRVLILPPRAADYLVPRGVSPERIVWLPNGVDLEEFPVPPPVQDEQRFDVMYFGAHGSANGLESLLGAMALLAKDPVGRRIRLRLIGDGPEKPTLVARAKASGLASVSFEPSVPRTAIPMLAAEADAFVFSLIDLPVFRFGISSNKLFDYLAGARPILYCCNAVNNPVAEAGAGISVSPGDPGAIAAGIRELASLPLGDRRRMGDNARRFVEANHDYRQLAARLADVLETVTRENGV